MTLVETNGCKGFIVYLICKQDAIPNDKDFKELDEKWLNDKQNFLDTHHMDIGAATQERFLNYLKKKAGFSFWFPSFLGKYNFKVSWENYAAQLCAFIHMPGSEKYCK